MERVLEIQKLTGDRYLISLESGLCFPLYRKEITDCELRVGEEIPEETLTRIMQELLPKRARLRAMHLLEKMDRTETQLRQKLKLSNYPEEIIEDAINYVRSYHYIDDFRFARNYLEIHSASKSLRQMEQELSAKGISKEIIAKTVSETELPDEEAQIRVLLKKKHYDMAERDPKTQQKMYAFLARRGYSMSTIAHVLHSPEE